MQLLDFCLSLPHPEDTSYFHFWGTKLQLRSQLWKLEPGADWLSETSVPVLCSNGLAFIDYDPKNNHFIAVDGMPDPDSVPERLGHNLH